MLEFVISLVGAAATMALLGLKFYAAALTIGILVGVWFFLRGAMRGGRLGNIHAVGRSVDDFSTRIGVCHAATGVAAGAIGHVPAYPIPFVAFYWLSAVLASTLAVFFSYRTWRAQSPST